MSEGFVSPVTIRQYIVILSLGGVAGGVDHLIGGPYFSPASGFITLAVLVAFVVELKKGQMNPIKNG
jgi:uncharacterized membrane protein YjjP (DUF1212 family)